MTDKQVVFQPISFDDDAAFEKDEAVKSSGRALVVVAHTMGFVVSWQAGQYVRDYLHEGGADDVGFPIDRCGVSGAPIDDGIYIGDLVFVDDGPGDWPGSREVAMELQNVRKATKEEWAAHCDGEWPWDPSPWGAK